MRFNSLVLACAALGFLAFPVAASDSSDPAVLDVLIAQHARAHRLPEALVHRVIRRESNYNPRALSRGNYGLMQIRYATARGMGYMGSAAGLLDANTNLTYAVPYLANAYLVAGRNHNRAVALYSRGYYYEAKRKGLLASLTTGEGFDHGAEQAPVQATPSLSSALGRLFAGTQPEPAQQLVTGVDNEDAAPSPRKRARQSVAARVKSNDNDVRSVAAAPSGTQGAEQQTAAVK